NQISGGGDEGGGEGVGGEEGVLWWLPWPTFTSQFILLGTLEDLQSKRVQDTMRQDTSPLGTG
ncbi:Hypothetical predicted protein, partial [Xyrichtys novacula]